MTSAPPRWTTAELAEDAATSAAQFRTERLAVTDSWATHYNQARGKFDLLFKTLSDLNPGAITDDNLAEAYGLGLGEALRYLAGPPISDDDLQVIADVDSIAPGILKKDPEALRKVFGVIERVIDPCRFPWMEVGGEPTAQQREAALLASSVLLAAQRIATERRNEGKENQETTVKDYLRTWASPRLRPLRSTRSSKGLSPCSSALNANSASARLMSSCACTTRALWQSSARYRTAQRTVSSA
jgi:XamI restriction endonuclease.